MNFCKPKYQLTDDDIKVADDKQQELFNFNFDWFICSYVWFGLSNECDFNDEFKWFFVITGVDWNVVNVLFIGKRFIIDDFVVVVGCWWWWLR